MKVYDAPAGERDALVAELVAGLVAELAEAAYRIALRHGERAVWVDLELDLWRALTEAVKKWDSAGFPDGAAARRPAPEDAPPHIVGPRALSADCSHLVGGG